MKAPDQQKCRAGAFVLSEAGGHRTGDRWRRPAHELRFADLEQAESPWGIELLTIQASSEPWAVPSSYRHLPGFLRDVVIVNRQLKRSDGLVKMSLWAEPSLKRYWTLSIWQDKASMTAFVGAEPHRSVMRRSPERLGDTAFEEFEVGADEIPVPWDAAIRRLND